MGGPALALGPAAWLGAAAAGGLASRLSVLGLGSAASVPASGSLAGVGGGFAFGLGGIAGWGLIAAHSSTKTIVIIIFETMALLGGADVRLPWGRKTAPGAEVRHPTLCCEQCIAAHTLQRLLWNLQATSRACTYGSLPNKNSSREALLGPSAMLLAVGTRKNAALMTRDSSAAIASCTTRTPSTTGVKAFSREARAASLSIKTRRAASRMCECHRRRERRYGRSSHSKTSWRLPALFVHVAAAFLDKSYFYA